jgi:hypothetical protein
MMSYEHRVAIEKIVNLCSKSRSVTKRIERIYDIGLESLGLTANQRQHEIDQLVGKRSPTIISAGDKLKVKPTGPKPFVKLSSYRPTDDNWINPVLISREPFVLITCDQYLEGWNYEISVTGINWDVGYDIEFQSKGDAYGMYQKLMHFEVIKAEDLKELGFTYFGDED